MDIKSNYNVSFKAVSINPTDTKKASKVAQVINLGFDKLGKLRAEKNYDTFESLNKAHDEVTAQMSAKRRRINSRPWFVPKGGSLSRLDTKEMKLKENLDKQRIILLEREQRRIAEMKKVVNDVSTQACSYEEQTINDVKRFKNRDKMERFRARHSIVTGGFNSIAGYDSEKSILKKYFISEIIKEQEGKKANVPGSVLFFGPTGNGTTTFAKAFAKETGCELVPLRLDRKSVV